MYSTKSSDAPTVCLRRRIPWWRQISLFLFGLLGIAGCGSDSSGTIERGQTTWVRHWNQVAVDASGLDHTPVAPGEPRVYGEQLGPARASRAVAIVQIAIFDAINAIDGRYRGYTNLAPVPGASMKAAIAQAAYSTMSILFPSQEAAIADYLEKDLESIEEGSAKRSGIDLGRRAAEAILALREGDGSEAPEPLYGIDYIASDEPGFWRQDPISEHPLALGGGWSNVRPFVIPAADSFRTPPPPAIDSAEYAAAFAEAQSLGGDGVITPTVRTAEETHIGLFWAYDGTPSLCAPPRLYNQITSQIAAQMGSDIVELARLLALTNVAMADAAIAIWESKYHWEYWRPVTAIREADPGSGPTGLGDGNPDTAGDPNFTPLGAPASNLSGVDFTPPFPAYPSGHAGFGGALFETLRIFYGTDDIPFTFVSDEFNGITIDGQGNVRPLLPRSFESLSHAEEENGQSRIYLGIHWVFDKTEGIEQGRRVARYVADNIFTPR